MAQEVEILLCKREALSSNSKPSKKKKKEDNRFFNFFLLWFYDYCSSITCSCSPMVKALLSSIPLELLFFLRGWGE
jgi:hypothetical protein